MMALLLSLLLVSSPAVAEYKAPRTSFGHPDLQGLWTNLSLTNLERNSFFKTLVIPPEAAAAARKGFFAVVGKIDFNEDLFFGRKSKTKKRVRMVGYDSQWTDLHSLSDVDFGKVKGEYRTSWIVDPADGHVPYSKEALDLIGKKDLQRIETPSGPEDFVIGDRCIVGYASASGPPMLNTNYNNNYQIVQTKDYVVIVVEMNHDARIIRLNGKHAPAAVTPWMGDSIGRWEGDTLVVETTNLNPNQKYAGHVLYIPPTAKVTERFTRVSDSEIFYEFQVEDENAYTQPWRGEIPMRISKGPMYEFACHEGNRSMTNALSGARYIDKKRSNAK